MVGWWKGDGNALDLVGGNNGIGSNGVAYASGEVGQAFSFNGVDSYVEVPDSASLRLTNALTVEFWIQREDLTSPDYVVNKGGDWTGGALNYGVDLVQNQYGNALAFFFAGGVRTAGQIADLNWHHCAVVAQNGAVDPVFYIDGVVQPVASRQGAATLNLYPSTRPLIIGAQLDTIASYYSKALIDELSIYSQALSQSQIQAIYSAGSGGKCVPTPPITCTPPPAGMVGWWRGEGNALDVGGVNNGVLEGTIGFAVGEVGQGFVFNTTNADVRFPASASLNVGVTSGFTLEAWIYPSNTAARGPLFEWNNQVNGWGAHFWIDPGQGGGFHPGLLYANIADSSGGWHQINTGVGVLSSNTFQHVALTYDKPSGMATIYRNGAVVAQANLGSFTALTTYDLFLGRRPTGAPGDLATFSGLIDEPSVYSRALTQVEIQAIYNTGSVGKCVPTPPITCTPPTAGMVGWWKGDGNALDLVGGNNGNGSNGVAYASGEVGQAFSFNGVDSYVEVPDSASLRLTNALTVEFWIQREDLTSPDYVVNKGGDWTGGVLNYGVDLVQNQYGNALAFFFAGGVRTAGQIADLNWHHCAVVAQNGAVDPVFYIDGVVQPVASRQGAATLNLYPSTRPLIIGAQLDTIASYYSKALIDELSIYSQALSQSQIQAIYGVGSGGKCVVSRAPSIVSQPLNQTVDVGGTANFAVQAIGTQPLYYQWSVNLTNIGGATNSVLTLTNVQFAQAGNYAVLITNQAGSVLSTNAVLIVNPIPRCTPAPAGMVGWWKGDGNALDLVGGNNGNGSNGVAYASGELGQAFSFNGVDSYVEVPDSASLRLTNALTVEFWIQREDLTSPDYVVNKGGDWTGGALNYGVDLVQDQYGNALAFFFAGGVRTAGQIADLNWHHCAVVAQNGAVDPVFYIDGVVQPVASRAGGGDFEPVSLDAPADYWGAAGHDCELL